MPEVTGHAPGSFCWIELNTSDSAAKPFYQGLFGWQAGTCRQVRIWSTPCSRLAASKSGNAPTAGTEGPGVTPHWMTLLRSKLTPPQQSSLA
jgi:predicted enzyme related to lactoylglutathione lyase